MLRILDGLQFTAMAQIAPGDNDVLLNAADALKLNAMAVGDHTYFAVRDGRGVEVLRYNHTSTVVAHPGTVRIPVDRAQCDTVRRGWSVKSCLYPSLAECVLRELICEQIGSCA